MHANAAQSSPLALRHSQRWAACPGFPVPFGLAALAFPWLFSSAWPVVALACAAVVGPRLLATRGTQWARRAARLGRGAQNDIWFAGGVCLAYLWSATEPLAYRIAILVLMLAPTAACLIRERLVSSACTSGSAGKSAAGSLAFFVTALAIASTALIAGAGLRPRDALAAALLLATVTTGIEASMDEGLDNLFVPIGALVALEFAAP
jgi:dolichol kinase